MRQSFPTRSKRGSIGLAVLALSLVLVMITSMSFYVSWANFQTSLAFDSYHSQMVEMAGLQEAVQESILALRSTAVTNSGNSISTEINNRLAAMSFGPGVSITLTSASTPPNNTFYPFPGTPAPLKNLWASMFSASPILPGISGTGIRTLKYIGVYNSQVVDLGLDWNQVAPYTYSKYTFQRTVSNSTAESRTITVSARLFSVPVTNIDCVAYGLPSSGSVPDAAPSMPVNFFNPGVTRAIATLHNPANDPTSFADLYDPANPKALAYQWQNDVLFTWDAYEFIWSQAYQNALQNVAIASGALYDFDAPSNPAIAGVSGDDTSVTIDLGKVRVQTPLTLEVVDSSGVNSQDQPKQRTIQILGSAANGPPLLLYLRNTSSPSTLTNVTISGNNNRPILLISRQCALNFSGNPRFQGAIILDPASTAKGAVTLFGHLSFYHANAGALFPVWNLNLVDYPGTRNALASIAPRVLLVSTTASR